MYCTSKQSHAIVNWNCPIANLGRFAGVPQWWPSTASEVPHPHPDNLQTKHPRPRIQSSPYHRSSNIEETVCYQIVCWIEDKIRGLEIEDPTQFLIFPSILPTTGPSGANNSQPASTGGCATLLLSWVIIYKERNPKIDIGTPSADLKELKQDPRIHAHSFLPPALRIQHRAVRSYIYIRAGKQRQRSKATKEQRQDESPKKKSGEVFPRFSSGPRTYYLDPRPRICTRIFRY